MYPVEIKLGGPRPLDLKHESHAMKHVPFMLDQTWIPLALVIAIGIGLGVSWQRIGGSRGWSQRRTNFARITGIVAAAIPLTMVVLGTMWFNDHAIETLED